MRWGHYMFGMSLLVGMCYTMSFAAALISMKSTLALLAGLAILFGGAPIMGYLSWKQISKAMAIMVLAVGLVGCTRVQPGYVGIKVNQWGSDKGVESFPSVTGMQVYNPISTTIFEYPTFVQTAQWTKDAEDDNYSEEVVFNDKDGLTIGTDISLSYQLNPATVPAFYVKFRSDSLTAFTHGFMRNVARDAFNEVAGTMSAEEIYGAQKEAFLQKVRTRVNKEVNNFGVEVQQLGVIGGMRLPPNVIEALNNKIKATQVAQQKENELRATQADAAKQVAEAEGQAKAWIATAEGTAKANQIVQNSLTPGVVEWKKLEIQQIQVSRWNGQLPTTVAGQGTPFILGPR